MKGKERIKMLMSRLRTVMPALLTVILFIAVMPNGPIMAKDSQGLSDEMPAEAPEEAYIYEAEDAVLSGTARTNSNHAGFTGTGFVAGYDNSNTAATTFQPNVDEDGDYYIALRYAAGPVTGWPSNREIGFYVNETKIGDLTFEGTDAWNSWTTHIQRVTLKKGQNTIAYKAEKSDNSDVINLDHLAIWKAIVVPEEPEGDKYWLSSLGLDRTLGITAKVNAGPVNPASDEEDVKYVVFQLMKGQIPVKTTAVETDIADLVKLSAHFQVEDPKDASYYVNVFVYDLLDNTIYAPVPLSNVLKLE